MAARRMPAIISAVHVLPQKSAGSFFHHVRVGELMSVGVLPFAQCRVVISSYFFPPSRVGNPSHRTGAHRRSMPFAMCVWWCGKSINLPLCCARCSPTADRPRPSGLSSISGDIRSAHVVLFRTLDHESGSWVNSAVDPVYFRHDRSLGAGADDERADTGFDAMFREASRTVASPPAGTASPS